MSPYSASPCPCPSPSPAHCLLLLCATSAYSKLYNECVTIKPVPVQAKFKCHCYFRATKICRPFASSGLVETEETDSEDPARLPGDTLYSTRRRICSCYTTTSCCSTICLASLPLSLSELDLVRSWVLVLLLLLLLSHLIVGHALTLHLFMVLLMSLIFITLTLD